MSRPGIKPGRTSTENAHDIAPPSACVTWAYMNTHEHTWTAPGCGLNSTCKASANNQPAAKKSGTWKSLRSHCRAGQITSRSPLWRDLTKVISILNLRSQDWHVPTGNRTRASTVRGEHFEQLINSYSAYERTSTENAPDTVIIKSYVLLS